MPEVETVGTRLPIETNQQYDESVALWNKFVNREKQEWSWRVVENQTSLRDQDPDLASRIKSLKGFTGVQSGKPLQTSQRGLVDEFFMTPLPFNPFFIAKNTIDGMEEAFSEIGKVYDDAQAGRGTETERNLRASYALVKLGMSAITPFYPVLKVISLHYTFSYLLL